LIFNLLLCLLLSLLLCLLLLALHLRCLLLVLALHLLCFLLPDGRLDVVVYDPSEISAGVADEGSLEELTRCLIFLTVARNQILRVPQHPKAAVAAVHATVDDFAEIRLCHDNALDKRACVRVPSETHVCAAEDRVPVARSVLRVFELDVEVKVARRLLCDDLVHVELDVLLEKWQKSPTKASACHLASWAVCMCAGSSMMCRSEQKARSKIARKKCSAAGVHTSDIPLPLRRSRDVRLDQVGLHREDSVQLAHGLNELKERRRCRGDSSFWPRVVQMESLRSSLIFSCFRS
jgi:hypothetical protein